MVIIVKAVIKRYHHRLRRDFSLIPYIRNRLFEGHDIIFVRIQEFHLASEALRGNRQLRGPVLVIDRMVHEDRKEVGRIQEYGYNQYC